MTEAIAAIADEGSAWATDVDEAVVFFDDCDETTAASIIGTSKDAVVAATRLASRRNFDALLALGMMEYCRRCICDERKISVFLS